MDVNRTEANDQKVRSLIGDDEILTALSDHALAAWPVGKSNYDPVSILKGSPFDGFSRDESYVKCLEIWQERNGIASVEEQIRSRIRKMILTELRRRILFEKSSNEFLSRKIAHLVHDKDWMSKVLLKTLERTIDLEADPFRASKITPQERRLVASVMDKISSVSREFRDLSHFEAAGILRDVVKILLSSG
jgi:hypothetical protein